MQDSLDQFERYAEKPKETTFFSRLVSSTMLQILGCNLSHSRTASKSYAKCKVTDAYATCCKEVRGITPNARLAQRPNRQRIDEFIMLMLTSR